MADTQEKSQVTNQKSNTSSIQKMNGRSKRSRNRRKKKKSGVAALINRAPVKEYVSKCCSATAKKPSTGKPSGISEKQKGATDPTQVHGLGGWRCSACGKPCKVTPQTIKPKEEVPIAQ